MGADIARRDGAAVRRHASSGDGEPKAEPRARADVGAAHEGREHACELLFGHAGTLVPASDDEALRVRGERQEDRGVFGCVAKRVARNVVDGPCDQVAVRIDDGIPLEHRLHGHVLLLGLEAEVVGNALEDVRETDGRLRHVGAVFKTGIGEKRLHQCVDVADLLLDASERVLRACGVAPRKLKRHLDARERAADLVAHVVKEPSLPCDEGLDLVRHAVEDALTGGSGRATIDSPAAINVEGDKATATIVWSSPNYDYMLVDGEKYEPVNKDGNSTFEIPVSVFDAEMEVTADTVAMSEPHEIDYTLNFDSTTAKEAEKTAK